MIALLFLTFSFFVAQRFLKQTNLDIRWSSFSYFSVRLYLFLGISIVPGAFMIYFLFNRHYLLSNLTIDDLEQGFYWIGYSIMAYGISIWFLDKKIYGNKGNRLKIISQRIVKAKDYQLVLTLLLIITIYEIYLFRTIGYIPLLKLFSVNNTLTYRAEITSLFSSLNIIKELFQISAIITSYYAYSIYLLTKKSKKKAFGIFAYSFVLAMLMVTHKFEKGPFIFYILGFMAQRYNLGYRVKKSHVIRFVLIVSAMIFGIFFFYYSGAAYSSTIIIEGFFGRIFVAPTMGYYLSLNTFPMHYDFLGFSSVSRTLSSFLGIEHSERSARLLQYVYNAVGVRNGTAGVINSYYLGEAWANFGYYGLIIGPFYVSSVSYLFYRILISLKNNLFLTSVISAYTFQSLLMGGFNDFYFNLLAYLLIFVLLMRKILLNQ